MGLKRDDGKAGRSSCYQPFGLAVEFSVSILRILPSNMDVKAILAIGMVVIALGVLGFQSSTRRLPPGGAWRTATTPWPGSPESNAVVIPLSGTNSLIPLPGPAWQPLLIGQSTPQLTPPQPPASSDQLPTRVYRTLPYTCIVVVPGPCADDRAIVSPSSGDYRMPIIRPDLQFILWGPAK
jgi:hypothetical protein